MNNVAVELYTLGAPRPGDSCFIRCTVGQFQTHFASYTKVISSPERPGVTAKGTFVADAATSPRHQDAHDSVRKFAQYVSISTLVMLCF